LFFLEAITNEGAPSLRLFGKGGYDAASATGFVVLNGGVAPQTKSHARGSTLPALCKERKGRGTHL
jgi:hypothetical protein